MFSKNCMFNRTCKKKDSEECNKICFPFVVLHGSDGKGGFWRTTGVPTKYKTCLFDNLPIKEQNPIAYGRIEKYLSRMDYFIEEKGVGLFLYSKPTKENYFGTGTGKTTSAITILNEYVLHTVRKHLKGEKEIKNINPALFVRGSEFQNKYNSQFRGSQESQKEASETFYKFKGRMKKVPLLVIDDIAVRDCTEAFKNEMFEIIDHRATEGLATIYTSNLKIEEIKGLLGERITSRIDGMTVKVEFIGKDNRKGGIF